MSTAALSGRKILLIVGGGIAAYKALELVRLLKKSGAGVMSVLTPAGVLGHEQGLPHRMAGQGGQRHGGDELGPGLG